MMRRLVAILLALTASTSIFGQVSGSAAFLIDMFEWFAEEDYNPTWNSGKKSFRFSFGERSFLFTVDHAETIPYNVTLKKQYPYDEARTQKRIDSYRLQERNISISTTDSAFSIEAIDYVTNPEDFKYKLKRVLLPQLESSAKEIEALTIEAPPEPEVVVPSAPSQEDLEWEKLNKKNLTAVRKYMKGKSEKDKYYADALGIAAQLKEAQEESDYKAFEWSKGKVAAQSFLKKHPDGKHSAEVNAYLSDLLQQEQEAKAKAEANKEVQRQAKLKAEAEKEAQRQAEQAEAARLAQEKAEKEARRQEAISQAERKRQEEAAKVRAEALKKAQKQSPEVKAKAEYDSKNFFLGVGGYVYNCATPKDEVYTIGPEVGFLIGKPSKFINLGIDALCNIQSEGIESLSITADLRANLIRWRGGAFYIGPTGGYEFHYEAIEAGFRSGIMFKHWDIGIEYRERVYQPFWDPATSSTRSKTPPKNFSGGIGVKYYF